MSIGVICRMNQARSPFAEGVLTKNFPEHEFFSSGIEAVTGSELIDGVAELAKVWDIELTKKRSSSINDDLSEILDAELIICAELKFESYIRRLGYQGKIVCFEHLVTDSFLMPIDPEGLSVDKFKRELAKTAALSIKAVREHLGISFANSIQVITPNSTSDSDLALSHAIMESKINNAILVDVDFRAPNTQAIKEQQLNLIEFDIKDLTTLPPLESLASAVLSHKYQLNHPGEVLLSPTFASFLAHLTQLHPVTLLTAPRYTSSNRLSESFIISAYADKISLISA